MITCHSGCEATMLPSTQPSHTIYLPSRAPQQQAAHHIHCGAKQTNKHRTAVECRRCVRSTACTYVYSPSRVFFLCRANE